MRKTSPLDLRYLSSEFTSLKNDTSFLPSYTPVFITDGYGRIVKSKGILKSHCTHPALSDMMIPENYLKFLNITENRDVCVAEAKMQSKSFIIISKTSLGFYKCVLTSFSEEYCKNLAEYFDKLCLYKDYLFSFGDIDAITAGQESAFEMLVTLIGGVTALSYISRPDEYDKMQSAVDADMYVGKLISLIKAVSANNQTEINLDSSPVNAFIGVSRHTTRFISALASLMLRQSRDGKIKAELTKGAKSVKFTLCAKVLPDDSCGIYEKALTGAATSLIGCRITREGDILTVCSEFDVIVPKKVVISDDREIAGRIDGLLSDRQLYDLIYTVIRK